ncbi:hypothetical protein SAMN06265367_107194 [Algoriphagus winogradskyi]|uniref:Interferon-induced transmembrane protein n=1 Tax=Algoriphagus winogradskyi TaxID=237017 RepID=A0ABY1PCX0_9BACT|nr:hypothetical protein SAMN06265367_107194 [Algoriphagus winogradskyi]
MEIAASFALILSIYFLGCLALIQEVVRPNRQLIVEGNTKKGQWVTNYSKILLMSFGISLLTTFLAYYLFL